MKNAMSGLILTQRRNKRLNELCVDDSEDNYEEIAINYLNTEDGYENLSKLPEYAFD